MKKYDKAVILFIGALALIGGFRNWYFEGKGDEMAIDGHRVSLVPCRKGINELFGSGIDSNAMCKCLLPRFYLLLKNDPAKIEEFKEVGFLTLQGKANDSAIL